MSATLTCNKFSRDANARDAALVLDEAISLVRNRGHTRGLATQIVASRFGVNRRRVQAILNGEPVAVRDAELAAMHDASIQLKQDEVRRLDARAMALRAELATRQQAERGRRA